MQAALEKELEEVEGKAKVENPDGDKEMGGTDDKNDDGEDSDTGSEDLEAESSDDDDDEDEEEAGEGDEDVEMGEGEEKAATETHGKSENGAPAAKPEVMAH